MSQATDALRAAKLSRMGITFSSHSPKTADEPEQVSIEQELAEILDRTFDANAVSEEARQRLIAVVKHYAQEDQPYRACVRDNIGKFGPGKTERVCATLKDVIRSTTSWRSVAASDNATEVELNETHAEILSSLTDEDYAKLEEVLTNE